MPSCTFFGHRECPETIRPTVRQAILELIFHHGVDMFYVGHQGRFDQIILGELRMIKSLYDKIDYAVVLAYLPERRKTFVGYADGETIFPEGIESVHPRFAISWRNNWMLARADHVVVYTTHSWGGAAKYAAKARRMNKNIWHIVKNTPD